MGVDVKAYSIPRVNAINNAVRPKAETDCSERVELFALFADGHFSERAIAPNRADDSNRDIDEEDPAPISQRQDQSAKDGAGHAADGKRDGVESQSFAAFIGREDFGDQRHAVDHHHRRAAALYQTENDQLGGIAGKAA